MIGVQANVLAGGRAQRRLAASLNERQRVLLALLAVAERPLRASLLFGQAALLVRLPENAVAVLTRDARELDILGLVRHEQDSLGCMALRITASGRQLAGLGLRGVARLAHARAGLRPVSGCMALCALLPSLLSCAAVDPPQAPRYHALPPPLGASQRTSSGMPVWSLCRSTECEKPTPKTPAVSVQVPGRAALGAGTPALTSAATAASAPSGPVDQVAARAVAQAADGAAGSAPDASSRQSAGSEQLRFAAYSLYFPFGRATVASADDRLVQSAAALARNSSGLVHVVGMTDAVGPPAVNEALARRRASEVKARLIAAGVDAARVSVQTDTSASVPPPSFSTSRTAVSGNALYRRADIVVRWNADAGRRGTDGAPASLQRS